jgi:hypothetical protein
MKYMKLYGSMAGNQHAEVARLLRRIERYRRALRRCARRRKREREAGTTLREPSTTRPTGIRSSQMATVTPSRVTP